MLELWKLSPVLQPKVIRLPDIIANLALNAASNAQTKKPKIVEENRRRKDMDLVPENKDSAIVASSCSKRGVRRSGARMLAHISVGVLSTAEIDMFYG